jgi:hypothetical protein
MNSDITGTKPISDNNPSNENTTKNSEPKGRRDHLPVHPAADLFPLMSEPELRELGEDIKKNGL